MKTTTGLLAAALLCTGLAGPAAAQGDARTTPLFAAQLDMGDVLQAFKRRKKALVLVVSDGTRYTGMVKDVGPSAVILTGLEGKEFFDAWIPLGAIVAMEERVRMR